MHRINNVMIIIMNKTLCMMRGGADSCNANKTKVTNDSKVLFGTHQTVIDTGTVTHHSVG